ncbi:hypothetical protein GMRT_10619 [Giardia muris]|uniref:Uncharacterized protein n=1 Tax=Giardia muris TaxID=5742 RepID=A0A4Z1SM90_GIAMU|nr:hypothetical protein GMRT_10619 [Giardia muris]|eukprot:TNJ26802.1 hypothetical protein GMRT_10619 [Giardia muris]
MIPMLPEYMDEESLTEYMGRLDPVGLRALRTIERRDAVQGDSHLTLPLCLSVSYTETLARKGGQAFIQALMRNVAIESDVFSVITHSLAEATSMGVTSGTVAMGTTLLTQLTNDPAFGAALAAIPNFRKSAFAGLSSLILGPLISRVMGSTYQRVMGSWQELRQQWGRGAK